MTQEASVAAKAVKIALFAVGGVILVAIGWAIAIRYVPPSIAYRTQIAQVERYVAQIEEYKRQNGRYPDDQTQTIVPRAEHDNPFFYEGGGTVYRIGFRVGFDEVYFYDSQSRRWSFER